jgi:RNA polymerase sigma-70 factor (ECF subfamily)
MRIALWGNLNLDVTVAAFASLQGFFGFVPNLFRAQIPLPQVIDAEATIVGALLTKERFLYRKQKLLILLAVAAAYRNAYWVTANRRMLLSSGVPERQVEHIIIDSCQADLSEADGALINFAVKLARNAPWISARDIALLRAHGFAEAAGLEAIAVTALSNFFCTLSVGLHPKLDFDPCVISPRSNFLPFDELPYIDGISGPYLRSVKLSPNNFAPFAFFVQRFGFIPNIFHAQTLSPELIEAEAELIWKVIEPEDLLSHLQKEYILLVASAANLNTYCVAVHCEMLRAMRVSIEESDQIAINHRQANLSEANKALLDFVRKLAVHPSGLEGSSVDILSRHGFSEKQLIEVVAVTALGNFFNILQMGLGTTPDVEPKRIFVGKGVFLPYGAERRADFSQQNDPDAGFVTRVQNGDTEAFGELVVRHSRRVYRTLVAIIGNVEEAHDAMQDTFLKAFEHIGDFQQRSKFSTWLLSIAGNTALQRLRDRKRLEYLDEDGDDPESYPRQARAWEPNPEQSYSQAEQRSLVEAGLMKLPSKYRVVLVLRDIEQLSTEEAATALGLGIPALKARLLRGRLMLREALSPHFSMSVQKLGV